MKWSVSPPGARNTTPGALAIARGLRLVCHRLVALRAVSGTAGQARLAELINGRFASMCLSASASCGKCWRKESHTDYPRYG